MDLFVIIIDLDEQGKEVTSEGTLGQLGDPVARGWLRLSHRALDEERSLPYRPMHRHEVPELLVPDEIVPAVVEILPTSRVFGKGHRLGLVLQAADRNDPTEFLHNDPVDRDLAVFAGTHRIHSGGEQPSYLLLPVIPSA